MNRFAMLSLYRSLIRHKLYAALNIGGLAVGIAVFLVLSLYVRFETSFETWLPKHDGIYLVQTEWHIPDSPFNGTFANTMGGLLDQMREDYPGIIGTRIRSGGTVLRGGSATKDDVAEVDPTFFEIFDLPMVAGDGRRALAGPTNALISATAAQKYFGTSDPIGQTLTVSVDGPVLYRVAGVFKDLPKNTDLQFSILLAMPKRVPDEQWYHWGSTSLFTYLRFPTPRSAFAFSQTLRAFADRRGFKDTGKDASKTESLSLLPIARSHLQPQGRQAASLKITVATLGIVGVLALLIAIVNYINLATARAGLRAREVAIRKVLGADRGALIRQFLGEAILLVAVASLGGLILTELGLPLINAAGGLSLTIPYGLVVPALVLLSLIVGVIAGAYPALLLSRFPAASVLASARAPGGGRAGTRTREALVVFQFGLAIAFMIGTGVLVAQTIHVRHTDLGFRRDGLLVLDSLSDSTITLSQARSVLTAIRAVPGVVAAGAGNQTAGGTGDNNSDNVPLPGHPGAGPSLRWIAVGQSFFDAYGAKPIAGRLFDDTHGSDDSETWTKGVSIPIVINRKAVAALGFRSPEDAIGKTVGGNRPRTIIGVVEDLRFLSPRLPTDPTYYRYFRNMPFDPVASIRFNGDPKVMLSRIRAVWQRTVPQVPFDGATADTLLNKLYLDDDRATRLFAIGAGLAVLIGCIGLWGLASFNTQRRVKEIGIRKTLGASSGEIVRLLVGQFLRPVLIANLIAWPLAFAAMRNWLAGFDDRISLSPLYFIGASFLTIAIAVLTVVGQSYRASRATPAWAMRHE